MLKQCAPHHGGDADRMLSILPHAVKLALGDGAKNPVPCRLFLILFLLIFRNFPRGKEEDEEDLRPGPT